MENNDLNNLSFDFNSIVSEISDYLFLDSRRYDSNKGGQEQ